MVFLDSLYYRFYEWDGQKWQQNTDMREGYPSSTCPCSDTIAYDSIRMKIVSFKNGDLWEWDGVTWTKVYTYDPEDANTPGALQRASMTLTRTGVRCC